MTTQSDLITDLQTLNNISLTLNQAADVQSALNSSLAQLVELMGLETGWVFVIDPAAERPVGRAGLSAGRAPQPASGIDADKPRCLGQEL